MFGGGVLEEVSDVALTYIDPSILAARASASSPYKFIFAFKLG
jgi:hypothetical protein